MSRHPQADELVAFSAGKLDEEALTRIEGHLTDCAECRESLKSLPTDRLTALLREPPGGLDRSADEGRLDEELPAVLVRHPRYLVVARVGSGGMGVIFKAEHRLMKRVVALKVISPRLTASPAAVARFRREMEAVAKLSHPNVAAAYDADETGGQLVLVEEYVEGTDLAQVVQEQGPLPVALACGYARQAALALQHAHDRGILHRDIKPHNLILTGDGRVKVLDFGLATLRERQGEEDRPVGDSPSPSGRALTDFGQGVGTVDFAAPEQMRDAYSTDARSDIYSLGCTLRFLLTGQTAASSSSLPTALVALLDRMTAPDPQRRPQTMTDVAEALTPFASGEARGRRRKLPLLLAGLVLLLAVAAVVVWNFGGTTEKGADAPKEEDAGEVRKFTGHDGIVRAVCFTPDGKHVLSASLDKTLRLWDVETGEEVRRFTGHKERVIAVAISRDGWLAVSGDADATIRLWDVRTGRETRCIKTGVRFNPSVKGRIHGVALSPDGACAASSGDSGHLGEWDVRTGEPVRSYKGHKGIVHSVQYSLDGKFLVSAGSDHIVRVWDRTTQQETQRFDKHPTSVMCAVFSLDGKHVLSCGEGTTTYLWERETGKVLQTLRGHARRAVWVTISPDGRRALTTGGHAKEPRQDCTVRLWDLETGEQIHRFDGHEAPVMGVAFSLDGRYAISCSEDKSLRLWRLPPIEVPEARRN